MSKVEKFKYKPLEIECIQLGNEFREYPIWVHIHIKEKKMIPEIIIDKDNREILRGVRVSTLYKGIDRSIHGNEWICRGAFGEIFLLNDKLKNKLMDKVNKK